MKGVNVYIIFFTSLLLIGCIVDTDMELNNPPAINEENKPDTIPDDNSPTGLRTPPPPPPDFEPELDV